MARGKRGQKKASETQSHEIACVDCAHLHPHCCQSLEGQLFECMAPNWKSHVARPMLINGSQYVLHPCDHFQPKVKE